MREFRIRQPTLSSRNPYQPKHKLTDPVSALLGPIITGVTSLFSTQQGVEMNKRQMEWQSKENQKNRDWQTQERLAQNDWSSGMYDKQWQNQVDMWKMNNQYNSPAALSSRLIQAGINPLTALGAQGQGMAASQTPAPSTPTGTGVNNAPSSAPLPAFDNTSVLAQNLNLVSQAIKAGVDATRARKLMQHEIDSLIEDTESKRIFNKVNGSTLPQRAQLELAQITAEIARINSDTTLNDAEYSAKMSEITERAERIKQLKAIIDNLKEEGKLLVEKRKQAEFDTGKQQERYDMEVGNYNQQVKESNSRIVLNNANTASAYALARLNISQEEGQSIVNSIQRATKPSEIAKILRSNALDAKMSDARRRVLPYLIYHEITSGNSKLFKDIGTLYQFIEDVRSGKYDD